MLSRDLNAIKTFGQKCIVEPVGTALTSAESDCLSELQPAGVMLRARNFNFKAPYEQWLGEFSDLVTEIRKAIGRSEVLFTIDHEGGRVVRPPLPVTRFPYARRFGSRTAEVAQAMAIELKSLAINVNFAPVADIDEGCPVIGQRAFATDSKSAASQAVTFAKSLHAAGIIPVPKHFPGHGGVKEDSHFALPVLDRSLDELLNHELHPFQELIDVGIPAIMTAHLMIPALDKHNPATISHPILVSLLREKLGFNGVVFADALGMAAISDRLEGGSLAVAGIKSKLDLFVLAGDTVTLDHARRLASEMLEAVGSGQVGSDDVLSSLDRIEALLDLTPQYTPKKLDTAIFENHARLATELDPTNEWHKYQYIPKGF
jgi:beta-N-acetylhexosaminidase